MGLERRLYLGVCLIFIISDIIAIVCVVRPPLLPLPDHHFLRLNFAQVFPNPQRSLLRTVTQNDSRKKFANLVSSRLWGGIWWPSQARHKMNMVFCI